MEWMYFALGAPFFYAASNVIDKYALEQRTLGLADYMFFASMGSLTLAGYFYITGEADFIQLNTALPAVASGVLMNASYLLFAVALTKADSYRLTPFFLLIPIILVVIDAVFYNAPFTTLHLSAVGLALAGSVVLSATNGSLLSRVTPIGDAGYIMLLSVLLLSAGVFLMDKLADPGHTNGFVMLQCLGFFLATLLYLVKKDWRDEIVQGIKEVSSGKVVTFAVNDAADLFGNWLFVAAVAAAPSAGFVSLALGIQPFYVMAIVFLVGKISPKSLNEDISFKKGFQTVVGALLLIGGLFLLAMAGS